MQNLKQTIKHGLNVVAAVVLTAAGSAYAAVPPELTTAATALQTDGSAGIAIVGGAMLTLAGVAVLFKWVKAAFF